MSQTYEETVMDENGWVKIPSAIRTRIGLLEKTDVVVTSYSDGIIMVRRVSGGKPVAAIKKTQAALRLEELFEVMHANNLGVSDEEIAEEIKEHRKTKRNPV